MLVPSPMELAGAITPPENAAPASVAVQSTGSSVSRRAGVWGGVRTEHVAIIRGQQRLAVLRHVLRPAPNARRRGHLRPLHGCGRPRSFVRSVGRRRPVRPSQPLTHNAGRRGVGRRHSSPPQSYNQKVALTSVFRRTEGSLDLRNKQLWGEL